MLLHSRSATRLQRQILAYRCWSIRHGGFAQAARAPGREMQTVGAERHCSARSRRVSCAQRAAAQPRELLDAHPDLPGLRTWAPFTGHQPRDSHVPVRIITLVSEEEREALGGLLTWSRGGAKATSSGTRGRGAPSVLCAMHRGQVTPAAPPCRL